MRCGILPYVQNNRYFMAGIYVHIPFCKTRCDYCDFYSTTLGERLAEAYVEKACGEMRLRRDYLGGAHVNGVYFGGGTPTRLSIPMLGRLCDCIYDNFEVDKDAEITVEANPDDLCDEYVSGLRDLPFNRVSMGVQSFNDALLAGIHRRHSAAQAEEAFERLRGAGIGNISIDLIYGLPGETVEQWEADVEKAVELRPEHISAYALTYESGTPLYKRLQAGEIAEADEDSYLLMYGLLTDRLRQAGYEHYEISNFALNGRRAVLNSSYWKGEPYIGIGPGAHSYNGTVRRCNIPDVERYVVAQGDVPHETESLDAGTCYDEMVMTRLRTCDGLDTGEVERVFGKERYEYLMRNAAPAIRRGLLEEYELDGRHIVRLTRKGIFVSDEVISDLMAV